MSDQKMLDTIMEKLDAVNGPALPELMTQSVAAQLLDVKPQTMALWRTRSKGPNYIKIGSGVRYTREAIADYIQQNTITT